MATDEPDSRYAEVMVDALSGKSLEMALLRAEVLNSLLSSANVICSSVALTTIDNEHYRGVAQWPA